MYGCELTRIDYPILVVAYDDRSRAALVAKLESFGVYSVSFSLFCEAESYALCECCSGVLVDLTTMIRSKTEEKVVAYVLTSYFPTLRVKTIGAMLVPMSMSGKAKQDKTLNAFLTETCAEFTPRRLRSNRRKNICIPAYSGGERGFTLNMSWSGVFIVDMNPERFSVDEEITVAFPDFGLDVEVIVTRIQNWGQYHPPGIGVKFKLMGQELERNLSNLLKNDKSKDRDR